MKRIYIQLARAGGALEDSFLTAPPGAVVAIPVAAPYTGDVWSPFTPSGTLECPPCVYRKVRCVGRVVPWGKRLIVLLEGITEEELGVSQGLSPNQSLLL